MTIWPGENSMGGCHDRACPQPELGRVRRARGGRAWCAAPACAAGSRTSSKGRSIGRSKRSASAGDARQMHGRPLTPCRQGKLRWGFLRV